MSTFKEIQGQNIKSYTTNPSDPKEGEMWYNQTTLSLKKLLYGIVINNKGLICH